MKRSVGVRERKCWIAISNDGAERPLDRVQRQLQATRPNQVWVVGSPCVATWTGFVDVASSQHLSTGYPERLAKAGIEPSVGSVGGSCDSALAESIIGLYKAKIIRKRGPWRKRDAGGHATLLWVDRFNKRRLLEPVGNLPPAKIELACSLRQEELGVAA